MTKTRSRDLLSQHSRFARNALSVRFQFGDTINGASGFQWAAEERAHSRRNRPQQPKSYPRGFPGRSFGIEVFVSNIDQRAAPEKQRSSVRRRAESAAIRINLFRDSFRLSRASGISIERFVGDEEE